MKLPVYYNKLNYTQRRVVREQYIQEQKGECYWCRKPLKGDPHKDVMSKRVNFKLFPPNFPQYPIHLQHDHNTGLTEGAVHMRCNAVMWQYHSK